MSFILDALKKSEAERQRTSTPGIADIPAARPALGRPRWVGIVAALLAVNLGFLVAVLLRPGADAETPVVTRPLEVPDTAPSPSFSELVAAAKQAERNAEPLAAEAAPAVREEVPARAEPEPVAREPVDIGSLVTFQELKARGDLMLPDLHLDLHVYGDRPADRFIVVNMNRYKEGAALSEGPVVREILPNGVVLEHQGTRFFLARQ